MKVAFRADASLQIGSGHVMRCLTLADALKAQGAQCHFISRPHPGHLLEAIQQPGRSNSLLAPVATKAQGTGLGVRDVQRDLNTAGIACDSSESRSTQHTVFSRIATHAASSPN